MPPALVQSKKNSKTSGTTASITGLTSTGAGNHLVMTVTGYANPGNITFTPPAGWVQAGTTLHNNVFISISTALFYYENNPGGISSVSVTLSGTTPQAWHIEFMEFSGVATSSSLEATTAREQDTTTSPSSGPITTTAAGDLLIGWTDEDDNNGAYTFTYPSGWTALTGMPITDINGWGSSYIAYQVAGAAGSYNWNPTLSNATPDGNDTIVAFKAAGGGGGANTFNQSVVEKTSATDSRLNQATRPVAGDTQSALDASTRNPAKMAADMTSGADTTGKTATKPARDAHSGVDVSVRTPQKALFEARSDLDTVTRGAQKATFDIQSGFDSLLKATQAVFGDPISALDSLSHLWSAHLALYEALSGLDTVQKAILAPLLDRFSARDSLSESNQVLAGQNWSKTLADALSETDVVASLALVKLLGDAYASTEGRRSQIGRPLYDVSSGQDSLRKAVAALLDDAGVFTDAQRRLVQTTLAEVTSSVDRVTAGKVLLLTLLDQVGLLDAEMTTYTKVQYGLLALLTSLVASSLGVNIAFANTSALGATTSIIAPLGGAATVSNSSALGGVTTLVAANLALSFSIPF